MRRLIPVAVLAALLLAPGAGAWSWPTDGAVLRPFVLGIDPYAGGQHRGVVIAGAAGSTVGAPAAGTVTFAGTVPTSGRSLTILTADGYSVTLTHLGSTAPKKGDAVQEGDAVGTIGPSGDAEVEVPYVHLGVRLDSDPNGYVDPLHFLPARVPAPSVRQAASSPVSEASPRAEPAVCVFISPTAPFESND